MTAISDMSIRGQNTERESGKRSFYVHNSMCTLGLRIKAHTYSTPPIKASTLLSVVARLQPSLRVKRGCDIDISALPHIIVKHCGDDTKVLSILKAVTIALERSLGRLEYPQDFKCG